jgi:hypothetical protein
MTVPENTEATNEPQTYTVHFTTVLSTSVTVGATDADAAIALAYEEAPGGICALCSGWGEQWSRDDSGDMEAEDVTDAAGVRVWSNGMQWAQVPDKAQP